MAANERERRGKTSGLEGVVEEEEEEEEEEGRAFVPYGLACNCIRRRDRGDDDDDDDDDVDQLTVSSINLRQQLPLALGKGIPGTWSVVHPPR